MYKHKVQYYETDKMGITHHSNYIRWMEEARVDFLDQLGYSFDRMESEGIVSPVVSVECAYKKVTKFPEVIDIDVKVDEFKGVKLRLKYIMKNDKDEIVCEASSLHCFLSPEGRPLNLAKTHPELNEKLRSLLSE